MFICVKCWCSYILLTIAKLDCFHSRNTLVFLFHKLLLPHCRWTGAKILSVDLYSWKADQKAVSCTKVQHWPWTFRNLHNLEILKILMKNQKNHDKLGIMSRKYLQYCVLTLTKIFGQTKFFLSWIYLEEQLFVTLLFHILMIYFRSSKEYSKFPYNILYCCFYQRIIKKQNFTKSA